MRNFRPLKSSGRRSGLFALSASSRCPSRRVHSCPWLAASAAFVRPQSPSIDATFGEQERQVEHLEFLDVYRSNLTATVRSTARRPAEAPPVFLVLEELEWGRPAPGLCPVLLLGQFLELDRALALRRVLGHDVAELDARSAPELSRRQELRKWRPSRREKQFAHRGIPPVSRSKPAFAVFLCRLG